MDAKWNWVGGGVRWEGECMRAAERTERSSARLSGPS